MAAQRLKNRRRRGATLIEVLMASLIISIGVMGMVNMWTYSYYQTQKHEDTGMAYVLGRQQMEATRILGFTSAPEGTTTWYFTAAFESTTNGAAAHRYTVTRSITSSAVSSGTAGQAGAVPATTALRTVTINVTLASTNATLHSTSTYLASGGI